MNIINLHMFIVTTQVGFCKWVVINKFNGVIHRFIVVNWKIDFLINMC